MRPDLEAPETPAGLHEAGAALWDAIAGEYDLEEHESRLLLEMCRTADLLDLLHATVSEQGAMLEGRIHPAAIEARQARIAFARLAAALRLPSGEDGGESRRPQRRVGARGVYQPRAVS